MSQYICKIDGEYRTVEAFYIQEALKRAEIEETDDYECVEGDDFEDRCLMSAITDEMLFGERGSSTENKLIW